MPREIGAPGLVSPSFASPTGAALSVEKGIFRKEGEYWTIGYGGKAFRLKDSKGLVYLAQLLRHPWTEFHALDLVGATAGRNDSEEELHRPDVALPQSAEELESAGIHIGGLGDAGELLDEPAKAAYRRRLSELREEVEEAKRLDQFERAARAEQEIEALTAELSRAVGRNGRNRRAASAAERARQSVAKALKTGAERIAENDATLGAFFSRHIRTGTFCSYNPDPNSPIAWEFGTTTSDLASFTSAPENSTELSGQERPEQASSTARELLRPLLSFADRTVFVGREAERSHLRTLVDHAFGGQGSLVMLGGGPGVGKTRLAMEMGRAAARQGFRVLSGRCYEREEPHPYVPFAEILETALTQASSLEEFRDWLGDDAIELAQLAPRLRRVFPDIPAPLELPSAQARRYLFQSIAESLARLARQAPLLLILDDLQWADESTLALIYHLANRVAQIPVLVVGTYRSDNMDANPALLRTLEELLRIGLHPIKLQGLSQETVAQMLKVLSNLPPPQPLVNVIYEETQGNPFFVEEVYKHLVEEGKIFDAAGRFRLDLSIDEVDVPENVRLVLDRRLNRLGEKTLHVLAAAAVIGRSFSFKLLVSLLDHVDIDDLLTAIEDAQRMGLMVSSSEGPEAPFTFAHELVRQTLLANISLPRRQRLHLRVADAIERMYASAVNEHAAEMAHHLVHAGSLADAQRVVHSLALAGRCALEAAAYEEALRHVESALSHGDAVDLRQRAELLSCLALAQRGLGRWDDALASWRDALDICTNLGDHELVDGICFKIVVMLMWVGRYREAEQIAQRSLVQLPGEASTDRVRARTAVGLIKTIAGDYPSAQDAFCSALASADQLSDHKLQALILAFRSHCNLYFLRLLEAIDDGLRSAELRHAEGSLWLHVQRLCWMQQALYSLGRGDEAARIRDELEPLARKSGHFGALALCLRIGAWTEFGKDLDLNRLEQQLRQDLEINETVSLQPWIATAHTQLSLVEFFRGNWEAGLEYAEEAYRLELHDIREGFGAGALFRLRAYVGDRDDALALLSAKRATLPRSGELNTLGSWALLLLVIEGLVILGEREQAAQLYPLVRQLVDTGTICLAWISRFSQTMAGVAAAAGRQWDAAEKHFHLALQQAEHFPHRLEQVEIRRFYGAMLLGRGAPNDQSKAHKLLNEAVADYTRIGMPRYSALTKALLDKCRE